MIITTGVALQHHLRSARNRNLAKDLGNRRITGIGGSGAGRIQALVWETESFLARDGEEVRRNFNHMPDIGDAPKLGQCIPHPVAASAPCDPNHNSW
jgi:hypothetical protein